MSAREKTPARFSADLTKIRIAELKADGDGGSIQRLRQSCVDTAAVLDHTANLVAGRPLSRKQRAELAEALRRGAIYLRSIARFSAPKGAK